MPARIRRSSPPTCCRRPNTAPIRRCCCCPMTPRTAGRGRSAQIESQLQGLPRADIAAHRAVGLAPDPGGLAGTGVRHQQRLRAGAPDPGLARAARAGWTQVQAPARSSSATGRPKRWATTAAAPTTCCRPAALRALTAASAWRVSRTRSPCSPLRLRASPRIGACAVTLATAEGLDAHANAVPRCACGRSAA